MITGIYKIQNHLSINILNFVTNFIIKLKSPYNNLSEMIEQIRKKFPYGFLVLISAVIVFLYFTFVKLLVIDMDPWSSGPTALFLIIYHIFVILLIWSLIMTIKKDPGLVPIHWGFSMQQKAKKYCLICHVFKPERTHHCSACNRCILNMDHHCPWINGCVGFYNRKPFILMNFYTTLITFLNIIAVVFSIPTLLKRFQHIDSSLIIHLLIIVTALVLNCIIFVTILLFLKFHIDLILRNYTTLETLQLKRQNKDSQKTISDYDIGKYYNWIQVFGKSSWTWWLPVFLGSSGPSGDGVIWPKRVSQQ